MKTSWSVFNRCHSMLSKDRITSLDVLKLRFEKLINLMAMTVWRNEVWTLSVRHFMRLECLASGIRSDGNDYNIPVSEFPSKSLITSSSSQSKFSAILRSPDASWTRITWFCPQFPEECSYSMGSVQDSPVLYNLPWTQCSDGSYHPSIHHMRPFPLNPNIAPVQPVWTSWVLPELGVESTPYAMDSLYSAWIAHTVATVQGCRTIARAIQRWLSIAIKCAIAVSKHSLLSWVSNRPRSWSFGYGPLGQGTEETWGQSAVARTRKRTALGLWQTVVDYHFWISFYLFMNKTA